jgi:hypothetical protein
LWLTFEYVTYICFIFKPYASTKFIIFPLLLHIGSVDIKQEDFWTYTEKENSWQLQNGQSELEKLYYTQSGESYLEKWHVWRRCFSMQLTVVMQFIKIFSLNFQSKFSSSPTLTHKKEENTSTRNCTIKVLSGSKFSNTWHFGKLLTAVPLKPGGPWGHITSQDGVAGNNLLFWNI